MLPNYKNRSVFPVGHAGGRPEHGQRNLCSFIPGGFEQPPFQAVYSSRYGEETLNALSIPGEMQLKISPTRTSHRFSNIYSIAPDSVFLSI